MNWVRLSRGTLSPKPLLNEALSPQPWPLRSRPLASYTSKSNRYSIFVECFLALIPEVLAFSRCKPKSLGKRRLYVSVDPVGWLAGWLCPPGPGPAALTVA